MLEHQLPDLRRCAACHDQCQFATLEVFARGSMVFDTSRKAALLIALAEGKLRLTDRAIEVVYSGLSSGVQHDVCVYQGDPDGWPDETQWLRAAREEVVRQGRAPSWAVEVRDAIVDSALRAPDRSHSADTVHLRGRASATADPRGHEVLVALGRTVGIELGLVEGESGFETFDLGFTDDAKAVASALCGALEVDRPTTVVCDAPEAVWMIREVWPRWGLEVGWSVLHTSEWLIGLGLESGTERPLRKVGYHDPAALARGLGVVSLPRDLLIAHGATLVEFSRAGREALPVGGYYGAAQGAWVTRIAGWRIESAIRLGMAEVVVASPYDLASLLSHGLDVTTLHGFVHRACVA